LWALNKCCEKEGKSLLLIFDQFEILQSHPQPQSPSLTRAYFELHKSKHPLDIYPSTEKKLNEVAASDQDELSAEYEILSSPGKAKAVFVIREDKLGTMSLLSDLFPDILKNDFIIEPLSKEDAFEAINEPARAEGNFLSQPFTFENDQVLIDLIAKIADPDTQMVDPIQLQIVARDLERNVVIKKNETTIGTADIPEVADIINKFYTDCWDTVAQKLNLDEREIFEIKRKVVPILVVADRRDLVFEGRIKEENARLAVEILRKEGLIRKIISGKDTFYQLSHDRLIEPNKIEIFKVAERKKAEKAVEQETKRMEDERKQAIEESERQKTKIAQIQKSRKINAFFAVCIFVTILISFFIFYRQSKIAEFKLKEERVVGVVKVLRNTNPTFAYELLKNFSRDNIRETSDRFNNYLAYYENSNYAFQRGVYPFQGSIIDVTRDNKNATITITDNHSITTWNSITKLIVNQKILARGSYLKKKNINGKIILLVENGDSLELQNAAGKVEQKFLLNGIRANNVDISNDGKYLFIGRLIYRSDEPARPIGNMQEFSGINNQNAAAAIFLNDSRHIVAGYNTGYKVVYRINEGHKDKVRVSAIFRPAGGKINYAISCLETNAKGDRLYAGTGNKTIEVWNIDSLAYRDSICDMIHGNMHLERIAEHMRTSEPFKILEGHNDGVNTVSISPNDSFLLSGSDDNTAILWNCNTWRKLSIVKGRTAKVKFAGFSGNDLNLYTATEDELLFTWSREDAAELYRNNQLSKFSPFDYYNVGLGKHDDFKIKIFDTVNTVDYFANTFHYIISMPTSNQYPEDMEYLENITTSLGDIQMMFNGVTRRSDFKKLISAENRKKLYKYYNALEMTSPDLMLKTDYETRAEKINRLDRYCTGVVNELTIDTSITDIGTAIDVSRKFMQFAGYYFDSAQYRRAIGYDEKAKKIVEAFSQKFSADQDLKTALGVCYGVQSYHYVFVGDYAKTLSHARKGLALDSVNGNWIYTNLALGYLFNRQFAKAEEIYRTYKGKLWYDKVQTFKEAFLTDFAQLDKAGIPPGSDIETTHEIAKIKKLLK
jgi:WD40 repeat protein